MQTLANLYPSLKWKCLLRRIKNSPFSHNITVFCFSKPCSAESKGKWQHEVSFREAGERLENNWKVH